MRARRWLYALMMAAGAFPVAVMEARALTEPATGLAVAPPAPFRAELTGATPKLVEIGIISETGLPIVAGTGKVLCKLRYQPAVSARDAKITQDWLNGRNADEDWRKSKRREIAPALSVIEEAAIDLSGVSGVEYIAIPKAGPNAADVRVHLSIFETPRGRLTQTCATPLTGFEAARGAFGQIRSTITLPK